MSDLNFGRGPGNVHPIPARTPKPRRLLLVASVKAGNEVQVRYWQARFPVEAAAAAGIDAVEAFVGSGYYAIAFEIGDRDAQRILASYFNDSRVREFHEHLSRFVEGLPKLEGQFGPGDAYHGNAPEGATSGGDASAHYGSGDLGFAAGMYRWRAGEEPQTGDAPRGS